MAAASTILLQLLFHVFVFLLHNGPHCVNLIFPLALRLCTFPLIVRALSAFFSTKLSPAGYCLAMPLFCFAIFHAFRYWLASKPHSSFVLLTVSPAWGGSAKTRPTRGAWSTSRQRQQLPVVTIIHLNFHRCHYQLRVKVQVRLPILHLSIHLFVHSTFLVFFVQNRPTSTHTSGNV